MKIVCEACQAKYSISDDKVRGKAFKIRCKKCSHIIVVRSTSASMPVAEGSSSAQQLPLAEGSGLSGLTSAPSENSWHIVVEGEQVGPLSASDVRARLSRGEITGETFIWREGLADWQKISGVSEFATAGGGEDDAGTPFPTQPPTTVYPPGTAESAFAASPSNGAEADVFAAPTMVSSAPPSADLFASPVSAPAASPSFSFGSAAPAESPIRVHGGNGAGAGAGLTGQRHENSVLFSLSNLEALASPSASPVSSAPRPGLSSTGGSEGSGLIDIRSMAQMTLGNQGETRMSNDLPTFGAPQFSPVAPVLLPLGPASGPPKWVYALIAVGVLFAVVVGSAAFMMLRKPNAAAPAPAATVATAPATPTPPVAAQPANPPPVAANPPGTPVTPPAPANEVLPPREPQKPAAAAAGRGGKKGGKAGKGSKGTEVASATATSAPPAPSTAPTKAEPAAKRDRLDDLLDGALGTKPKATARASEDDAPRAKAAPAPSSAPPLDKSDIVKGMMGIQPKVKDCFNQFKVPGTAMMTVHLEGSGRVKAANVAGKFAGTPTGICLESAAKSAKFPATSTPTFQYPLLLH
jgi:predicted Zn finger-like uncharacterized protein